MLLVYRPVFALHFFLFYFVINFHVVLLGGSGVEPLDCVTARGYRLAWFPLAGRFVDFDTSVTYIVCFTCKTKFEIFREHAAYIHSIYCDVRPGCRLEMFASTVSCFLS